MRPLERDRVLALAREGRGLKGAAREAFLRAIDDARLQGQVRELLEEEQQPTMALGDRREPPPGEGGDRRDVAGYRILAPIGRGGYGSVHQALHVKSGATVALKTVLGKGEESAASIRREVATLASLRHPGIVRILDHGIHDGTPWYAMELERGDTLAAMMAGAAASSTSRTKSRTMRPPQGARTSRLGALAAVPASAATPRDEASLRELLRAVRLLCAPLAYLHGEGIVHRDLKPQNVIVRADGSPVLVDFGIVVRTAGSRGREALDGFDGVAGTVAYMAPEQIKGELVDARADLYALGCVLYEIVTGTPPFFAESVEAVVHMHLAAEPAPPSTRAPGCPAALEELILRLLRKEPGERVGYAEDVVPQLSAVAGDGDPLPATRARAYLYRAPLEGRDDVMARILPRLDALARGEGSGVVLISGEAGIGKTRLCIAAGREAFARGIRILSGECTPSRGGMEGGAFHPLLSLFQHLADQCRDAPRKVEQLLGPHAPVLAAHVPLLAEPAALAGLAPPPPLPGPQARLRLLLAVRGAMLALAARRPLLLLLDDLHDADPLTLDLLALLARSHEEGGRLLVLGTHRSDDPRVPLEELPEHEVTRVRLAGLHPDGVDRIVRAMLAAQRLPDGFVEFLAERSGGNPFHVVEYLRLAVSRDVLARGEGGSWELATDERRYRKLPLPRSVRELVKERLARIGASGRDLLGLLAVLGSEVDAELVEAIAPMAADAVATGWRELRAAAIVEDAGAGRIRLAHQRFREAGDAELSGRRRKLLHRRAALELEARAATRTSGELAALGVHWEGAGVPSRARRRYAAAAKQAVGELMLDRAEATARAALRLRGARPDRSEMETRLLLAAEVLSRRGQPARSLSEARRVERDAARRRDGPLQASAAMTRGNAESALGRMAAAARSYRRALASYVAMGDTQGRVRAMANLVFLQPHLKSQRRLALETLGLASGSGDGVTHALLCGQLAVFALQDGDHDQAERWFADGLAVSMPESAEAARVRVTLMLNRAISRQRQGMTSAAMEGFDEALRWGRRAGDVYVQAHALQDIAVLQIERGHLAEARLALDGTASVGLTIGIEQTALLAFNGGCLHELEGDDAAAAARFADALATFEATQNARGRKIVHAHLGSLEWRRGELDAARAHHERGLAIAGSDVAADGLLLVSRARMLRCEGRLEEARATCAAAAPLLEGNLFELHVWQCERGLLELACDGDAEPWLARARGGMERLEAGPRSALGTAVATLARAVEARARGEALRSGQLAADLPSWLR